MQGHSLPAVEDTAFEDATADFMRALLDIGAHLFSDLAHGTRPGDTLQFLCRAYCDLLGADQVVIRLQDGAGSLRGVVESPARAQGEISEGVPQISRDISGTANAPLGQLTISWTNTEHQPSPLDLAVADRCSSMALVVLERHLSDRRQLQAVALEREAFAGELHDDPVQVMTAVSLQLQRVAARLPDGEDRSAIQQARAFSDNAIERLRHVMFSFHPTTLIEDGLAASIEAYCESFVAKEGLRWSVLCDDDSGIPHEVAALGFRLSRNALVNVVEHAKANEVSIEISCTDGVLRIDVQDDGIGFDVAQVEHSQVGHLGIPHAVRLAELVAGTYVTRSEPGMGTTVSVELPTL